ncbi:MAG: tetratricopeptide repeat protein [Acidobacteria bacterium]|nr:tetratricopeptide repeat protein [Acidobacteriota bacterium]
MSVRKTLSIAIAAGALALAGPLAAQQWKGKGRVEGILTDTSGKPIPGAAVKLRKSGEGPDLATGKDGRWAFLGLTGGEWTVEFDAKGFQPERIHIDVSELQRRPRIEHALKPLPEAPPQAPPEPPEPGLPPGVVAAVAEGNEALARKDWPAARAAFEKAHAGLPENVSILTTLARSYSGEGNAAKAVETVRKITALTPDDAGTWLLLANLELERGQLEAGKEALGHVPQDFVKDPAIYVNIGVLYMNQKNNAEAELSFDKAVAIAPADGSGYYYRALARIAQKKNAGAKADLQKFLELDPGSSDAKDARDLLGALK